MVDQGFCWMIVQQIYYIMGQCSCNDHKPHKNHLPLIFQSQRSKQHPNYLHQHEFQFQLSNIQVLHVPHAKHRLMFTIKDIISIQTQKNSISIKQSDKKYRKDDAAKFYDLTWTEKHRININSTISQLNKIFLQIYISEQGSQPFEIIKIQLSEISFGPYQHNIAIAHNRMKFRVIFDSKMSHIFQSHIKIQQLKILTNHKSNIKSSYFTVRAFHDQAMLIQSNPSYKIRFQTNHTIAQQTQQTSFFKEQRPNISKIKHKNSINLFDQAQNKNMMLWGHQQANREQTLPSLTLDISAQEASYHYLQIMIWQSDKPSQDSYLYESKIPIWKILQKQPTRKQVDGEFQLNKSKLWIQQRMILITQKLYRHHNCIGECEIKISMRNEKMIKQSKYEVLTQNGPVYMNSLLKSISSDVKSHNSVVDKIFKMTKQLDVIIRIPDNGKSLEKQAHIIGMKLIQIDDVLLINKQTITYSDGQLQLLINNQNILLGIIQKLVIFVQNNHNPVLSRRTWHIILHILQRSQFHLENLCLKGSYNTASSIENLNKKKEMGRKYLLIINNFIYYALKGYGFSYELNQIHLKFFAFCFFRIPTFRQVFFQQVQIQGKNYQLQKRLLDYHNQLEPLSSISNNYSKISSNWKGMFYDVLQHQQQIKRSQGELLKNCRNKRWFMQISYKQDLFYDFVAQILQQLGKTSDGGYQRWKYIDGYMNLILIIMNELHNISIQNYSQGLTKVSTLILLNQNLANLIIQLISQKINVYNFEQVCICLDLLNNYLNFITKNKIINFRSNFNQNYFFLLTKAIFQADHFYSINRILIIIFDYFDMFTEHGKYQISMYLLGNIYFKLFYHWSKDIRYVFYHILLIKIRYIKHRKQVEIHQKLQKGIELIQLIEDIYYKSDKFCRIGQERHLYKKLKLKVQDKLKKNQQKRKSYGIDQFSIKNLLNKISRDNSQTNIKQNNKVSTSETQQLYADQLLSTPVKRQRSFSQNYLKQELKISYSPNFQQRQSIDQAPEHLSKLKSDQTYYVRRKRKPSIFLSPMKEDSSYVPKVSNELHYFNELTNEEMKNIQKSKNQFNLIKLEIDRYFSINGKPPNMKLNQSELKIFSA